MSSDKNYITPAGFKKLQDEFQHLKRKERPEVVEVVSWAAGNGDRSENGDYIYGKKRLREIDRRLRFLSKRMDAAEIVDPTTVDSDRVRFGATVKVLDEDDVEKIYKIVGEDETEAETGKVSWKSPIARALFKAQEGDCVVVKTPQGAKDLEIVSIEYVEIV